MPLQLHKRVGYHILVGTSILSVEKNQCSMIFQYALFGKSFLNIDKCTILCQGQEIVINT